MENKNILWIIGIVAFFLIMGKGELFSSTELPDSDSVCCKITVVYPGATPSYSFQERNYCSNVINGKPLEGANHEIVDNLFCEENIACPKFVSPQPCEQRDECKPNGCETVKTSEGGIKNGCTYPATFDCVPKPINWLQQSVYNGFKVWHLLLGLLAIGGYFIFRKK